MIDRFTIIKELKKYLRSHLGDYIKDIILFGSQATGTSSEESDYDILIIVQSKPDRDLKRKISDYCYDIELKHNIILDTHVLSREELNEIRGKQPVFQNAIQEGIYA